MSDYPDTPITREEQYLAAGLDGGDLPDPITREEQYLYEIATKMQGGGSAPVLETLTATENRTYTPDAGVDGFDKVVVDVEGGGTISDALFDNAPKIIYNQMTPEEYEYTIALGSGYNYAVAWLVLYDGTTPICIAESVKGGTSNVSTNPNIVAYFVVSSGDVATLICDLSSMTAPSAVIYKGQ